MDDPETWRWVWLILAFGFAVGELTSPGSFFLAPFAAGALVSAILAFADVTVGAQWIVFLVVSAAAFLALRPLARRLDQAEPARGIGARRLIGEPGVVLDPIPSGPSELGMVRIGREQWRAESIDGSAIGEGTRIKVIDVTGTRVVVWPEGQPVPLQPPVKES